MVTVEAISRMPDPMLGLAGLFYLAVGDSVSVLSPKLSRSAVSMVSVSMIVGFTVRSFWSGPCKIWNPTDTVVIVGWSFFRMSANFCLIYWKPGMVEMTSSRARTFDCCGNCETY